LNAAQGFALAIQQQIAAVQSITIPAELADKTISYAAAKTAYYEALRAAAPELTEIATGQRPRPPEMDRFAQVVSLVDSFKTITATKFHPINRRVEPLNGFRKIGSLECQQFGVSQSSE
jgi:hypothetical protein